MVAINSKRLTSLLHLHTALIYKEIVTVTQSNAFVGQGTITEITDNAVTIDNTKYLIESCEFFIEK